MININALILATRPATLLAGIGPLVLGFFLSYKNLHSLNILIAFLTLLSTLFMQIGTNLVNDYFDNKDGIDKDDRLGPKRVTSKNQLSLTAVKRSYQISLTLSFLFGIYLMIHGGLFIIILGLTSLLAAYCYTAGPFPLSRNALGELASFIFFGPVAVCGTFYLQNFHIGFDSILFSLTPGFISASIMSINNLRDRESDKNVNKKTLATLLSLKTARLLPVVFIILSTLPSIYRLLIKKDYLFILALFLPFLFYKNWKAIIKNPKGKGLNQNLKKTGQYLFLSSIINGVLLII